MNARDGGCTKPCCTAGAYRCQAHHGERDWARGGLTNVNELALACGGDNRLVEEGGWTTTFNTRGEVEWIPPAALDTGQARVNYYHRPERLLRPPEDTAPENPKPEPEREPVPLEDPWRHDDAAPPQTEPDDNNGREQEPFDPWGDDDTDEPNSGNGIRGP